MANYIIDAQKHISLVRPQKFCEGIDVWFQNVSTTDDVKVEVYGPEGELSDGAFGDGVSSFIVPAKEVITKRLLGQKRADFSLKIRAPGGGVASAALELYGLVILSSRDPLSDVPIERAPRGSFTVFNHGTSMKVNVVSSNGIVMNNFFTIDGSDYELNPGATSFTISSNVERGTYTLVLQKPIEPTRPIKGYIKVVSTK